MDDNSLSGSNVKVAVRVRPMNRRGECSVAASASGAVCVLNLSFYPLPWLNTLTSHADRNLTVMQVQ